MPSEEDDDLEAEEEEEDAPASPSAGPLDVRQVRVRERCERAPSLSLSRAPPMQTARSPTHPQREQVLLDSYALLNAALDQQNCGRFSAMLE